MTLGLNTSYKINFNQFCWLLFLVTVFTKFNRLQIVQIIWSDLRLCLSLFLSLNFFWCCIDTTDRLRIWLILHYGFAAFYISWTIFTKKCDCGSRSLLLRISSLNLSWRLWCQVYNNPRNNFFSLCHIWLQILKSILVLQKLNYLTKTQI